MVIALLSLKYQTVSLNIMTTMTIYRHDANSCFTRPSVGVYKCHGASLKYRLPENVITDTGS